MNWARVRRSLRYVVVAALAWAVAATMLEKRRMATPLPRGKPRAHELSSAALRDDLLTLAAPEMEGRRTAQPGGRKARAFIADRFMSLGLEPLPGGLVRSFSFTHTSIRALWRRDRPFRVEIAGAANVVGLVPGTQAGARLLLASAHYDHLGIRDGVLYPGADDNASGVAALLEIASWVRQHPLRHSIAFAAFDAEELGLRGAEALVADPGFPLARLDAVLNMDMIGRPDGGGLVVAGASPHPAFRPLLEAAAAQALIPVRLGHDKPSWQAGFVQDWTTASDHGPFAEAAIPFLYLGVEDHADYHGPGDTADKISADYHAAVAELALDLLRRLDAL